MLNASYKWELFSIEINLRFNLCKQLCIKCESIVNTSVNHSLHSSYFFCLGDLWDTEGVWSVKNFVPLLTPYSGFTSGKVYITVFGLFTFSHYTERLRCLISNIRLFRQNVNPLRIVSGKTLNTLNTLTTLNSATSINLACICSPISP